MSAPVTVASYPSLRANTWPTDPVELESTLTAMVAGIWHILDAVAEAAPLVVPTSPPIVDALANPDYAWDETTPGRLYVFLMDIATHCPHITPSVYIETFELVRSMFVFTWEHPVIVRNIIWEMELFFLRTFWNVAVRYDETFTEEVFHELTDSRYMRCLDPSTKLILQRTMDLEDSKPQRPNFETWRRFICSAYADYVVDVETKHPYVEPTTMDADIATSDNWVEEAVSMDVLPSDLESLADVELALEEALSAEIDILEELEAEAVDLSTSYSNRNITDTPTSTASAPAFIGIVPDIVVSGPTEERPTSGDGSDDVDLVSKGDETASQVSLNPVELSEIFVHPPVQLPPRMAVRTRPPFGSESTAASEVSLVENAVETSEPEELQRTSAELFYNFAYLFEPEPEVSESTEDSQVPATSSSASTSIGRFFKRPFIRGSMFGTARSKGTWSSTTSSSTNASSSSADSVPTDSSLSTGPSRLVSNSNTPHTSSSIRKFGTFVKRLVRRRGALRSNVANVTRHADGLAPPAAFMNRSGFNRATETEFNGVPVLGWDGEHMQPRRSWLILMGLPTLYWELKRAERRAEA